MGKEMMIQATKIAGGQSQRFRDALKSADLPADDIDLPGRTFFEFSRNGETVGWGGFETHGTDGLLRSMVVEPAYRSKGVGAEVLRVIEAIGAEQGIARFHLLTTTASGFFELQGYAANQRGSAPLLISQTEQFRRLCPGSACYMCKALSANARK
ncbi:MAG: GNAT family N-acetyltransferase [Pseudomonas sp.]|jgi:N-acetylglutamate synthase-like GNAT family acetyltransferase|uniref:GNAT family N-acetyltransferase n=1 Tax=Pseudomonas veronii TaxID=76761 RepID=A0A5M8G0T3_PSEVE|nr:MULTISPECIES: arsenic resistance N-acetyltransferase ArsN2 [Pseudomonas]MDP9213058.1 arsenic resistance N-acetyltransferase ArsN2 [Pseudomonadota bacterium]AIG03415.1 acetyltransferase [Pseudomonas fluorescens]AMT91262.1 acetyltransferase [Pseudomonas koreensis]KAA6180124.1 GNAT family N-acetyltransferase [Pseudomonas veronii]KAA6189399.1 GNAT family N-acetyltransferase [Pseudomonas veronii]